MWAPLGMRVHTALHWSSEELWQRKNTLSSHTGPHRCPRLNWARARISVWEAGPVSQSALKPSLLTFGQRLEGAGENPGGKGTFSVCVMNSNRTRPPPGSPTVRPDQLWLHIRPSMLENQPKSLEKTRMALCTKSSSQSKKRKNNLQVLWHKRP